MQPTKLSDLVVFDHSIYHAKVSLNKNNPPFWAVLLVGFTDCKNRPAQYSKLVGNDFDEICIFDVDFSTITVYELLYVCQQRKDDKL